MELNSYLDKTVAFVRSNKYSAPALAAAILCKLTPNQLKFEIENSGVKGNAKIKTFISNYLNEGRVSVKWRRYFGRLMADVLIASGLSNYGLLRNKLSTTKSKQMASVLGYSEFLYDTEFYYVNELSPKLIYLIEEHIRSEEGPEWHQSWTGVESSKENFAEFIKLDKKFDDAKGLEICPSQSFGVEIEITTNRTYKIPEYGTKVWDDVAKQIIGTLNTVLGCEKVDQNACVRHFSKDYTLWKVEEDISVGWEVVSPILHGIEGALELKKVFESLSFLISEHDFICIDFRCGLHLNLATHITKNEEWQNFINRYLRIEPGLLPLVSPARVFEYKTRTHTYKLAKSNFYCKPLTFSRSSINEVLNVDIESEDFVCSPEYYAIEFKKVFTKGKPINLLEIRLHNGTTSYLAALSWLALWMKIVNRFDAPGMYDSSDVLEHDFKDTSEENAIDLFDELDMQGIQKINRKLKNEIIKRRKKMRFSWYSVFPEKVESWDYAGFYDED